MLVSGGGSAPGVGDGDRVSASSTSSTLPSSGREAGEVWAAGDVPRCRHSAPVILTSPDPLQGLRKEGNGSRFWMSQDGESSEDDGDFASSPSSGDLQGDILGKILVAVV
ncbi:uncharacterized protein LOC120702571 [Panicum virgatum]|uniref:uncharacterized protein LOC120702571 n=1 Tax=Panicum virgatum TaxID=38727 RepID=UPI0019D5C8BC|nr:uncharacterized protein LOC120702571 [Panicum virgatum]